MFNQDQENPIVKNSFKTSKPLTMEQKASLTSYGDFSTPESDRAAKKSEAESKVEEVINSEKKFSFCNLIRQFLKIFD